MIDVDKPFLTASNYLNNRKPFIIYKPDNHSLDTTVLHLAYGLFYKLVKIAIHDLGTIVTSDVGLLLVKEALSQEIDTPTIFWIEDISVINDKPKFVHDVIDLLKDNENIHIIFTGIKAHCEFALQDLPSIEWDTYYDDSKYTQFTYLQPNQCSTTIMSPTTIHFRTVMNVVEVLQKEGNGMLPYASVTVRVSGDRRASLVSIIGLVSLGIHKGDMIQITSPLPYKQHNELIDMIIEGLTKSLDVVYNN